MKTRVQLPSTQGNKCRWQARKSLCNPSRQGSRHGSQQQAHQLDELNLQALSSNGTLPPHINKVEKVQGRHLTPNSGLQIRAPTFTHANPHMHVHTQNKMQYYLDSVTGKGAMSKDHGRNVSQKRRQKKERERDEIIKGMKGAGKIICSCEMWNHVLAFVSVRVKGCRVIGPVEFSPGPQPRPVTLLLETCQALSMQSADCLEWQAINILYSPGSSQVTQA